MRRFYVDWRDEFAGLEFRVILGGKACTDCQRAGLDAYEPCGHDLVLQVWVEGSGWRPIPMLLAALITDFFCENEDFLYPPPRGQGGDYFLRYLSDARNRGYLDADKRLQDERRAKRERTRLARVEKAEAAS